MSQLPTDGQWRTIILRSGEALLWSREDLRRWLYVFSRPRAWRRWFAFERPVLRSDLGLPGSGQVRMCAKATPMGWISATGVVQHIHRWLLLVELPAIPQLAEGRKICRDRPVPSFA